MMLREGAHVFNLWARLSGVNRRSPIAQMAEWEIPILHDFHPFHHISTIVQFLFFF